MSIKAEYLDEGLGVLLVGEKTVTGSELIEANRGIFSSEERKRGYRYCLIDYSSISQFEVSNTEIEILAKQDKEASAQMEAVVIGVAAEKDLEFGLTRVWEIVVENTGVNWEIRVCRTLESAKAWIRERVKNKFAIDDLTFLA